MIPRISSIDVWIALRMGIGGLFTVGNVEMVCCHNQIVTV